MSWNDFQGKTPPPFGHAMLEYFAFDPGYTNLNHGSYGSLPRPISAYCDSLDVEAESNPDKWIRQTYLPLLTNVRTRLAALLGAKPEECVMVSNASHGISTVLRNLLWKGGDILVTYSTTYGSVLSTAQYLSDTLPHPTVSQIKITFPTSRSAVLDQFRAHLVAILFFNLASNSYVCSLPSHMKATKTLSSNSSPTINFVPFLVVQLCKYTEINATVKISQSLASFSSQKC
ncbi:PLP-dependent transferase [Mycena indigotica]|uniref:PLP-dependent transferase n=1 Tax=Mycena indigotica TaxID=2126181 RepID=A0A8H6SY69_9AGAR|nr:PLP-dependent transferase [Mycena indigotica]KAF7307463.1 PLP-dependent transferase [Mycena indigotica]